VFQIPEKEEVAWVNVWRIWRMWYLAFGIWHLASGIWFIPNSLILAIVAFAVWLEALSQWKVLPLRPCFGRCVSHWLTYGELQIRISTWL
jgi:hypothetical protein